MKRSGAGYVPAPGFLEEQMSKIPELSHRMMPSYTINEYSPLLDSSNMRPADWVKIANDIRKHYLEYDGFIVIHGTDTMSYTASALPFIIKGLNKPVIVTGSQIPLCEVRSDARTNLITSLLIVSNYHIPEVCLFFNNLLLRGCRSVKVKANTFDAFDSPNYPPLGTVGTGINIDPASVQPEGKPGIPEVVALTDPEPSVGTFRLFPGVSTDLLGHILAPPLRGLVLETYGVGNGPDKNRKFLDLVSRAVDRGVVIANCTQCLHGEVKMEDYASGSALSDIGVISGFDMTIEAALAKMIILFGQNFPVDRIKELFQSSLAGELTV